MEQVVLSIYPNEIFQGRSKYEAMVPIFLTCFRGRHFKRKRKKICFVRPKQTKQNCLCSHDWINWMNKLTFKDNISFCFFSLYMWQTLPPFLSSEGVPYFSPRTAFLINFLNYFLKSVPYYLINIANVTIVRFNFFKTTKPPFKLKECTTKCSEIMSQLSPWTVLEFIRDLTVSCWIFTMRYGLTCVI